MSDQLVWSILNRNSFLVRNAVKRLAMKTEDKVDVCAPETGDVLLECREPDIGGLTKVARLLGGAYDKGTAFEIVGSVPGTEFTAFRIFSGNATLTLGGPAISIADHRGIVLGKLKKKHFAFGTKYAFVPEGDGKGFILQIKGSDFYCDDVKAGGISRSTSDILKDKFSYAVTVSDQIAPNCLIRQVILPFAFAKHRAKVSSVL